MLRVVTGSRKGRGVAKDRLNSHFRYFQELFATAQEYKIVSQLRALFNIPFSTNLYLISIILIWLLGI